MDDTDMRFWPISGIEGLVRSVGSGGGAGLLSSIMIPGESLGVSPSSTAQSSLLVLLLSPVELRRGHDSTTGLRWLYEEEVLDFAADGLRWGDGIEMLAQSEWVSVVPGSACRLFLVVVGARGPAAEVRLCADEQEEVVRGLGGGFGFALMLVLVLVFVLVFVLVLVLVVAGFELGLGLGLGLGLTWMMW